METSFNVAEVSISTREGALWGSNPTTNTAYTITLTITGENIEGLGVHTVELPPQAEVRMCDFQPLPGMAYQWGYQYSYCSKSVAPVAIADHPEAEKAATRIQAVHRGKVARSQPRSACSGVVEGFDTDAVAAKVSHLPLNEAVLRYAVEHYAQQVDRGECWDLGYRAVTENGGKGPWGPACTIWSDNEVSFEDCLPGDILQMASVKFQYSWTGPRHTAVVADNLGGGKIKVLQCNWGGDKTVKFFTFDYPSISGESHFFRPQMA